MSKPLLPLLPLLALAFAFGAAQAQTLKSVAVEPATAQPGQPVSITTEFDISKGLNCNVRLNFGDGTSEDLKVNQEKDARMTVSHTYAKPGSYTVKAEPKTALPVLKCLGRSQTAAVTVAAPTPVAATTGAAAGPQCPPGWTLDRRSVRRNTGAFDCRAKAGTPVPQDRLACPGILGYYENAKRGRIGCRP
jgi:hypothetical protein